MSAGLDASGRVAEPAAMDTDCDVAVRTLDSTVEVWRTSNPELQKLVSHTMQVLDSAISTYGENLCISFNGGKDCTVLLHLLAIERRRRRICGSLKTLYIRSRDAFPEVDAFVAACVAPYDLELYEVYGDVRAGLEAFLSAYPDASAICMGTRRADPHGATLTTLAPTDPKWPSIMRVNAVLEWSYCDVWAVLRALGVPYCPLYDQGFTSLGNRSNTKPNPLLAAADGSYQPAYSLDSRGADSERHGRC